MTTLFPQETQYRVLSLWQPWASLLVHGVKKIETRPSTTSWTVEKGVYLIHAASKWTKEQSVLCMQEPFYTELKKLGYAGITYIDKLPLGQIIGAIEVTECCKVIQDWPILEYCQINAKDYLKYGIQSPEYNFGDYREGRFAWLTQNPRILKTPIPYKGGQGYYQKFKGDIKQLEFT